MTLSTAHKLAWSFATSLIVCITLFKVADGYGVSPTTEFDDSADSIIHEYDPFA